MTRVFCSEFTMPTFGLWTRLRLFFVPKQISFDWNEDKSEGCYIEYKVYQDTMYIYKHEYFKI